MSTNAVAAEHVMNAAISAGAKNVILLSTDKAAYLVNAIGTLKAMMEKQAVAKSRVTAYQGCTVCVTRYGNFEGSRGSVIPLFVEQIKSGKSITVTDLQMTRFRMAIDDAPDLVLFTFEHGVEENTFVHKATAATIETLTVAIKKLYAAGNPIQIIGTRLGGRLYETLLTREERARAQNLGKYFRVCAEARELNHSLRDTKVTPEMSKLEDYHFFNTRQLKEDEMTELLFKLVFIRKDMGLPPAHGAEGILGAR